MDAGCSAGLLPRAVERLAAGAGDAKSQASTPLRPVTQKLGEGFRRDRALKKISLSGIAADLLHDVEFFGLLDAFGDGAQLEVPRHGDDGAAQGASVEGLVNAANEAAVD